MSKMLKFWKHQTPAMTDWQMYGKLYAEKLRPLIDEAHAVACAKHGLDSEREGEDQTKPLERISFWGPVARDEYQKESDEVKRMVERALKDDAEKTKASEGDLAS